MSPHTGWQARVEITDHEAQRAIFRKTIQQSRIALRYDPIVTHPERFTCSHLAQRWFEAITAGGVVVGRRPRCPEADECLDWKDATIEAPVDAADVVRFLEDLLADEDQLAAAPARNIDHARRRHDWRHWIADMLTRLNLPHHAADTRTTGVVA